MIPVLASDFAEFPRASHPGSLGSATPFHALDQRTIADLPSTIFAEMTRDELVRVIRIADLPFLAAATFEHLPLCDRQTLERLANLARRCCLNRKTSARSSCANTTNN